MSKSRPRLWETCGLYVTSKSSISVETNNFLHAAIMQQELCLGSASEKRDFAEITSPHDTLNTNLHTSFRLSLPR
jgi:hypothetical protein